MKKGRKPRPDMKGPQKRVAQSTPPKSKNPVFTADFLGALLNQAEEQRQSGLFNAIPVEGENEVDSRISCGDCVGACCRKNVAQELTAEEAKYFTDSGNVLTKLCEPVEFSGIHDFSYIVGYQEIGGQPHALVKTESSYLAAGHGLYMMMNDCVFLSDDQNGPICTAYEQRPGICREFIEGAYSCRVMREQKSKSGEFGDWQPIELTDKPA